MINQLQLMMIQGMSFAGSVIDKTGDAGKQAAEAAAETGKQAASGGSANWLSIILMYAAILGVMYFLLIRPQRKREKEMVEMQSTIKVDDKIITSSGMFGKVVAIWHDSFLVEFGTNRSVTIPIRKVDIIGLKEPEMNAPKIEDTDKKDKK